MSSAKRGVVPCPKRTEAILSHPPPKNQRQLRQFLGVTNYRQKFIVGYANYVAPPLALLRKGTMWKWTAELQRAFEVLRAKFAYSIHLIHPDESLPYTINTDASGKAVAGILMQTNRDGETFIVSTASRVLNPTEQRYSVAEQELPAIAFFLEKFRIYVYGHEINLNTENKALSFINKCALTSNRISRWILQMQEYDLMARHISCASNFLADTVSPNPAGLSESEIKGLKQPRGFMVSAMNLGVDSSVGKKIKDLATYQNRDPRISDLMRTVKQQSTSEGKYLILRDVLYSKDKNFPYWRPVLPAELEDAVIQFVHTSLGHLGTEERVYQISHTCHVRNLGWKVRKLIPHCDICQRVKHPNRRFETEWRSHMPKTAGDLCAVDLYGPLPTGRESVRYILVCLDVFTKFVRLYALRTATTRTCLQKIVTHYLTDVTQPKCILSDNGTQFSSPVWKKRLSDFGIDVKFAPVRRPQANPSERCMRKTGKFCRIYCFETHRK
jgi:hypothetical protein